MSDPAAVPTTAGDRSSVRQGPLDLPLHHLSFIVDDLPTAIEEWSSKMHAGPFFVLEHMEFDRIEFEGSPIDFDHTAAFGQWGDVAIELQQFYGLEPEALRRRFEIPMNHVAYFSADAAADAERLEAAGMPMYLEGVFGDIHVRFHDAVGFSIELHQQTDFLEQFFRGVKLAATGWDGTDPMRIGMPPGMEGE